ncbi:Glucose transporter of the major facilitator superfamily, putative [Candida maltosa Xu316]|uniref:Glucose transporter of the major facilitator superfamily, putative n=1 Tax=Candida maltosa (strain Xu316) TaxID=1245528 RepID=M3J943_CANMX|nr:Glucose transporter of the major facilitator superfamily, putative [Candida maltosa Xu316]
MAELNSPELVLTCRRSQPGSTPYEDSFFGYNGFRQCIPMTAEQIGLATSIFSIGGLVGSFYVGHLADKHGRKKTSLLHCLLYIIGSSINGLSNTYVSLLIGRFICGLGAGSALVITSIYINEVSPIETKGLLGSMNQLSINIGILFTQLLSLKWSNDNDWRWLLFMGSFLAIANLVVVLVYLTESPVWLANQGDNTQAFTVLHRLRGGSYTVATDEVNSWKNQNNNSDRNGTPESETLLEEGNGTTISGNTTRRVTVKDYVTLPEYRNSLIASTGILVLQQFDGINSIIFYGVSVLVSIFPNHSIIINCLISLINVVVTFVSATIVDKLGRKPLLLLSVSVLGFATVLMGLGIIWTNSVLSIVGTFTYITFFAIGLGPIPFLLVGEVTQPIAKASAQSWGTSMNWIATFIVGYSFPVLKEWLGGSVYFIFTIMCGVSVWFITNKVPETKGKHSYMEVWGNQY